MNISSKIIQIVVQPEGPNTPASLYVLTEASEVFVCVENEDSYKWRPVSLEIESPQQLSFGFIT